MAFYKVCGNYYGTDSDANSLKHYRTPGSKNGVRKYQYEDGTLTPAGKIHYGVGKGATTTRSYTDIGTGQGPTGLGRLAYKVGGTQGYANYRKASANINKAAGNVSRWGNNAANDVRKVGDNVGEWVGNRASDVKNLGEQAGRDVGNAVNNAKNWVGDRASDVKNWGEQAGRDVGTAVNNAREWTGNRFSEAKELGSKAVSDAKNWTDKNVTGGSAKNDYDLNMARATVSSRNSDYDMSRENPNMNSKAAQRSEDTERTYRDNAAEAKRTYDDSLAGKAEKAVSDVKKAGDKAGSWIGDRAKEAGNTISKTASDVGKAAKNAGDWVGDRAKDVGKAASKAAKDVSNWGSGAVSKGRDFITGLFGKKKK